MKPFLMTVAILHFALLSSAAQADAMSGMQSQIVNLADLNLESRAGRASLVARIESAARHVCGLHGTGPLPIELATPLRRCFLRAKAQAISEVEATQLSRVERVAVRGVLMPVDRV